MTTKAFEAYSVDDPSVIPRVFILRGQKMVGDLAVENGWYQTEQGMWRHPMYDGVIDVNSKNKNKKGFGFNGMGDFKSGVEFAPSGNICKFPTSTEEEDVFGFAWHNKVACGGSKKIIRSNKWLQFEDTRRGKRKKKYYKYLDERERKRAYILEEENPQKTRNSWNRY